MLAKSLTLPLSDFDPLQLYLQLGGQGPGFLESVLPGKKTGRYSLIPLRVRDHYEVTAGQLSHHQNGFRRVLSGACWQHLQERLDRFRCMGGGPFPGGWFGLLSYDLCSQVENLPRIANRDLPVPDLWLCWVDVTAVYDHLKQQLTLATLDPKVSLEKWARRISLAKRYRFPPASPRLRKSPQPTMEPHQFQHIVRQCKAYIEAGDIYQANLSCRFDALLEGPSWALYHRLRQINPAPFACLLHSPAVDLISASPERLVSLQQGRAETRPIAGTRPRGYTPPDDLVLGKELLGHPKERAEHIMLLDLERNDLGKVCRNGSVEVDELMGLERYSHVTHIVSNVRGDLRSQCGPIDLLRAMFPGGTITGVPKKRCMEIIDELEPTGRGSYTGSVGYISANGNLDLNLLIRGFQRCGDHLSYQVGAGIVADSDPHMEWQECLAKGAAMAQVLDEL